MRFADPGLRFRLEKLWQRQPAETKRADFYKVTPGDAVTEAGRFAIDGQHAFEIKPNNQCSVVRTLAFLASSFVEFSSLMIWAAVSTLNVLIETMWSGSKMSISPSLSTTTT